MALSGPLALQGPVTAPWEAKRPERVGRAAPTLTQPQHPHGRVTSASGTHGNQSASLSGEKRKTKNHQRKVSE